MDDDLGNLMDDNVEEHGELMSKSPANVADVRIIQKLIC